LTEQIGFVYVAYKSTND